MITNLLLAILLIALTIIMMISLDTATSLMNKLVKRILKWTHRSKLLTTFILQAYIRYRKTLNKPLIHNPHHS